MTFNKWIIGLGAALQIAAGAGTAQAQVSAATLGIDPAVLAALAQGAQAQAQAQSSTDTTGGSSSAPTLPSLSVNALPGADGPPDQAIQPAVSATSGVPFDYHANLNSEVFGAHLFTGAFTKASAVQYNPDYIVAVGDRIHVRMWGAYSFNQYLVVDPQGNVFLPNVGPVHLLGTRNDDLQGAVRAAIGRAFRANVQSYASLAEAQPVRVFVTGFVNRPGLYNGTSADSLLHYLDMAGGVDPDRGSFISVQVKRGEMVRKRVNLYEFLFRGVMPQVQLGDGDVIFVGPRQNTVTVGGLAENANVFEFPAGTPTTTADVILMARPQAAATHMRITRNTGSIKNVEYYPLSDAPKLTVMNGDEIDFTADKKPGTITVRIEGEHDSQQEYVLPYGSHLGDLLHQVKFSARSDADNIQLIRQSVKDRQKDMLNTSLNSLQMATLTARSGTNDESMLRRNEADLVLKWIDRARQIEPIGQVVIGRGAERDALLLENGDVLHVPAKDGLVLVSGEVLFPNAIAYSRSASVGDYVKAAGGFAQKSGSRRIVVAHADGSFDEVEEKARPLRTGDQLMVLPRVDVKSRQILKDMTQILYQIAVSAKVVLGL